MRRKAAGLTKIRILEVSGIALAVFDLLLWHNVLAYDMSMPVVQASAGVAVGATSLSAVPAGLGAPVRIKIPRIGLDTAIEQVGLAADGSMGIPKKPRNTAWYALGPRPGETGSAVIAGHVNWLYGATAAFAKLNRLKPGDTITVRDDKGAVTSFVVRTSHSYGAAEDATDVFFSNDGNAHLNLVTCIGTWDARAKQYTKRLVVFADRVPR